MIGLKCTPSYENYSNTENANPMRLHKGAFYVSAYHEMCQELTPGVSVLQLFHECALDMRWVIANEARND